MKRFFVMGAACALVCAATSAQAQRLDERLEKESQFSVRAGAFLPFEDVLTDVADVWFGAGADIEIPIHLFQNSVTVFSLDWFTHNSGSRDNIFPAMVSQRWYSGPLGQRTYFQVGIGAAFVDFVPSDTLFAARGGIGMEINDMAFVEANFYWTEEDDNGITASGIAAFVGVRF
ncbi:MAG: hypothetical protein AKCLJLPJ_01296 [Fimbriimonadales bacterium]|nr:hypothetical protein [Fimbriimonadales bacterium]